MAKLIPIKEAVQKTVQYIRDRKDGVITSLKTGYPKLDSVMIDGIEWNSTITIGGRPSVGKSAVSDCILEGILANNKQDFMILDFNWELSAQVMLVRRLSSKLKKSYKYILSADHNTITDDELDHMQELLIDHYGELPIQFCEEPLTIKEFAETIIQVCEESQKKVVVRVDHTLLAKQSSSDGDRVTMLLNLLMKANELKKKYPVIFIFLTQINREFETRQEDGSDTAFPRQGDVYGGDAAAMFSETIILLNKPSKYGIRQYGRKSNGLKPIEQDDLYMHVVKNRNSTPEVMLHYKENFKNMSIQEL